MVLGGFALLVRHETTPGVSAKAPARIDQKSERPRLMLFLHPECPCSRATVSELSRLMTDCKDRLETTAYVYSPHEMPADWAKGSLYRQVQGIPHVKVELDRDGERARQFGAQTSGQVLLYSSKGTLVFSGGITPGRAHEGDNDGCDAIAEYLKNGKAPTSRTPVYGCALGASRIK